MLKLALLFVGLLTLGLIVWHIGPERIYEAAVQYYLQTGTVDEKVQREMIAVAAQRVKPKELPPPERVFDFSFAQKVSDSLK